MPLWTKKNVSAAINAERSVRPAALRLWKGGQQDEDNGRSDKSDGGEGE